MGLRQQAFGDAGDFRGRLRVVQERLRIDAFCGQPVLWQKQAALAGIFADIAGNVGQLHGKAKVASTGQRISVSDPHQNTHHRANSGGDAGRIG